MAFNISGAAIRRPVPSLVLFSVLLVLGVLSFRAIPITRAPNIEVPVITVTVTENGAAPSEMETQITRKVEDAVAGVAGVKHIGSTITDGVSLTSIEFRLEVPTDRALNDTKDAIAKIRADLPRDIDEPIIARFDIVGQAIEAYAASAPGMTPEQLSWFVDDVVVRDLQGLRGIGQVERIGGVTREIRVTLDPDRLMALGLTAGAVNDQLRAMSVDMAGGRGGIGGQEQAIRTLGGATTLDALRATRIVLPGGRYTSLGDLGSVTDTYEEPRGFARLNGDQPVVAFAVYRAKNASDVSVARAAAARIEALHRAHPDVTFTRIDDGTRSTYGGYVSAMHSLLEGALLATLVVFLFLRDWRATLLAAVALPLSILPAFWLMTLMDFSLNFVSLLAITLVTGILVDDAIVEIENIVRHMRMGKPAYHAAIEAADEIGLAVIAITLTIVAVFAPVSFMGGIPGQYFKQFGLTVAAAVLVSLLVARLLTPVMAAYFLKPHGPAAPEGWVMRQYQRLLAATLDRPALTLLAGLLVFVLSLWSTTLLPTGFIPPQDDSRAVLSLELPPGVTLEDTRAKTDLLAQELRKLPEVTSVYVVGGTTPMGDAQEVRRASMVVNLVPKSERSRSQRQVQGDISRILAGVPDLRGWYMNDRGERELSVDLLGRDPVALDAAVARLESAMRHLPGFTNVAASAGVARPELRVVPKTDEAARLGITTDMIGEALRIGTLGDISANLAKFRDAERLIPIRVQLDTQARGDLGALGAIPVMGATGISVPLLAVADLRFAEGPSSIERYDRERRVVLGADLSTGAPLGLALAQVYALPEAHGLPKGVVVRNGGDAEIMGEVFDGFANAMGAGLMMVLAVLVLLLGNVFQPVTILLSLPLSLGGVILALLLTHQPISLPVAIGILMLLGVVTKNAIMLVDFAVEERRRGLARRAAILSAGAKRARPIVMTTIAMVAGMVPSALGLGDGGEFRAPMATGVIGGLLVSTVLSLVFVPSFYVVMDRADQGARRLFRRQGRPAAVDAPGAQRHPAE